MWLYKFRWVTKFPRNAHIFHTNGSSKWRLFVCHTNDANGNPIGKIKSKMPRCQCVPWISLQLLKTIWFNSSYIHERKNFCILSSIRLRQKTRNNLFYLTFFSFDIFVQRGRTVPRLLRTITVFTESTRHPLAFSIVGDKRNCSVEHEGVDGRSEATKRSVLKKKTWVESSGNDGGS